MHAWYDGTVDLFMLHVLTELNVKNVSDRRLSDDLFSQSTTYN